VDWAPRGEHTNARDTENAVVEPHTLSFVTRVVLVHGSVANAETTFAAQQELSDRFELVLLTRSGYPPREPLAAIDFEDQADEVAAALRPGDHLVGHSYGGVVSLLAAARGPELASLTVSEPPAFGLALDHPAVREFLTAIQAVQTDDPREYLRSFLGLVGSRMPIGDRLPPAIEQGTRALMVERPPNEAQVPLGVLRAKPFPKLVISGAHSAAFDAVCDVLERELPAERAVLPGAGHSLPRAPGYNNVLADFVQRASVIETERLFIRPVRPDEYEEVVAAWLDPANARIHESDTEEQVRGWIASGVWGVWERATGELVGDCELHFDKTFQAWELSYGFRRDRWGRGYATEAGEACVRYGFERLGVDRIVADTDPENTASQHVLEKLGFRRGDDWNGRPFYELTRR
jgi:RimJ/RimL family protein N-acetyltransferase